MKTKAEIAAKYEKSREEFLTLWEDEALLESEFERASKLYNEAMTLKWVLEDS